LQWIDLDNGKSDRQKDGDAFGVCRQLRDFAPSLEIDKVHILHVSGGAPYGLALAYLLQERGRVSSVLRIAPVTKKNFRYLNSMQRKLVCTKISSVTSVELGFPKSL